MIRVHVLAEGASVGVAHLTGCRVQPSSARLLETLEEVVARAVALREDPGRLARKGQVRNLLRHGRYRPTGRAKPASEYLEREAADRTFPRINNLVDIINLVSLDTLWPVSLLDVGRAAATEFQVRWGREGESYVFNAAGQVLDLHDLLLVATWPEDRACGTPVKDSQATKTHDGTREALAVVYAPLAFREAAVEAARRIADLAIEHAGASATVFGMP